MSARSPQRKSGSGRARSGDDDGAGPNTPPRRARISHPLFDSPSPSTPPHQLGPGNQAMPVTPEHLTPNLLSALEMAARPGGEGRGRAKDDGAAAPRSSYTSSIEAMAAHVEAKHTSQRRGGKKPPQPPPKHSSPSKLRKRSGSSASSASSAKSSGGSRKSSSTKASKNVGTGNLSKLWMFAIPILISFLVFEAFLLLLVYRFKDAAATSDTLLGAIRIPDIVGKNPASESQGAVDGGREERIDDRVYLESFKEFDSDPIHDQIDDNGGILSEMGGEGELQSDDTDAVPRTDLMKAQSMLKEGFDMLRRSTVSSSDESVRSLIESRCGQAWLVADQMLQSESLPASVEGSSRNQNVALVASGDSPWKSLALEAQRCLGGAGLAFVAKNVDRERLQISTKIFDRLSYVDEHNPDVRAGLGTSLLIQGIFLDDNDDDEINESIDDAQRSLLSLASYHLKAASSLCSVMKGRTVEGDIEDSIGSEVKNAPAVFTSTEEVDNKLSASHAAILHNLALAYIALGDSANTISILLKAAALRPQQNNEKLYWNAPQDLLQNMEEMALLLAAKSKRPVKVEKKRIPFFG